MEKISNKIEKKFIKCFKSFNLWSVFKLLDPDPGEPIIYGSDWIRIRISNNVLKCGHVFEMALGSGPTYYCSGPGGICNILVSKTLI